MSNANQMLLRLAILASNLSEKGHHVSVEYSGARDEITVCVYRGGYRIGSRSTLEVYSTFEYSAGTIYSILTDLENEPTNITRRVAMPREVSSSREQFNY